MPTSYTSLLGLALPVTGENNGTWGDLVNVSITQLIDSAIAGTTTLSTDADVTLTTTTGAANEARSAVILWTANGSVTRNITAPAQSKVYIVYNNTAGSQSIVFRGAGPTAGVTLAATEKCVIVWNGSDFIKVSSSVSSGVTAIANGGTGQTTQTSAFDALAPTTTTGDLIYFNGTDNVRLPIGSVNNVLTVTGGVPVWAAPGGGSMVYPGAGVAVSTGSAWATSKTTPTGALVGDTDTQTLTNKTLSTGSTWSGNTIAITSGGTGAATATAAFNALSPLTTQGDVLYHNGTNNVRLAKGTALQVLRMNSGATAPEWATANSGTVTSVALSGGTTGLTVSGSPITTSGTITLAGTLAIANGGTGQTSQTNAFDALAPTTTAGDLIYHNGTDNVRLGLGGTGQILTVGAGSAPVWATGLTGTHGSSLPLLYGSGTGACGTLSLTGDTASSGNVAGGPITITGGAGVGTGNGGAFSAIAGSGVVGGSATLGGGAGTSQGGQIIVYSGAASNAGGIGGTLSLNSGNGGASGFGGTLSLYAGQAGTGGDTYLSAGTSTNGNGASVNIFSTNGSAGNNGGDINLTVGTGTSNGYLTFTNLNVANGVVATTFTSLGPTGASTTIQGWLRIKVAGTVRYIPFW